MKTRLVPLLDKEKVNQWPSLTNARDTYVSRRVGRTDHEKS